MKRSREDEKDAPTAATGGAAEAAASAAAAYEPPARWEAPQSGGKFAGINRPFAGARFERELPKGTHALQLHSLGTPNGRKATIMLEELIDAGKVADYDAFYIGIMQSDQFSSGFTAANPNQKIPMLLDYADGLDAAPTRVFESGAVLLYLADKYGAFVPAAGTAERTETLNWLFWQMGTAPYLGGILGHAYAYAPAEGKVKYWIDRGAMEAKRQLSVLDKELANKAYIAGTDAPTIADFAIYPWIHQIYTGYKDVGTFLGVDEYKNVVAWQARLAARPAVARGMRVNVTWEDDGVKERHSAADFDAAKAAAAAKL